MSPLSNFRKEASTLECRVLLWVYLAEDGKEEEEEWKLRKQVSEQWINNVAVAQDYHHLDLIILSFSQNWSKSKKDTQLMVY